MAYGLAIPGTVIPSGVLATPGGAQGLQGPTVISADAGNIAQLGTDSRIYVPDQTSNITSVRLRSFNAVGNPNFEVDQRNCFASLPNIASGAWVQDRWKVFTTGTMRATIVGANGVITLPGTSYNITQYYQQVTVTTAQASLAAGDYWQFSQDIEGPNWRELAGDVTSISLLVYSSVAGLKFSCGLRSNDATASLVKLCTIPSASTWTLIQLPNIPKPSSGSFPITPGNRAYTLTITLAGGSSSIAPAADTWQTGNFTAASGMSNLFATSGATFFIAFVQHEPGAQCTTLMDKPFTQNYDECLRYYCKSYDYDIKPGTASNSAGMIGLSVSQQNAALMLGSPSFPKPMAKLPTMNYAAFDGTPNALNLVGTGTNIGISNTQGAGKRGFLGVQATAAQTVGQVWSTHYTADTGW